jgi:hypothetical protein
VFLRPEWESYLVPIDRPKTRWLRLFRPHAVDLILTKMMRGNDPQDMEDVRFIFDKSGITEREMETAFKRVRIPDVQDLRDEFDKALPTVRDLLQASKPGN